MVISSESDRHRCDWITDAGDPLGSKYQVGCMCGWVSRGSFALVDCINEHADHYLDSVLAHIRREANPNVALASLDPGLDRPRVRGFLGIGHRRPVEQATPRPPAPRHLEPRQPKGN